MIPLGRPNVYLSIIAPTPTRSTLLSETSSTRTALARPLINAWVACATFQGGMIENPNFIPTLEPYVAPEVKAMSRNIACPAQDRLELLEVGLEPDFDLKG